jgi:hypothetical protein
MLRGESAMLAALLADVRPVAVNDRELTLEFPADAAFLKRKAEQDGHRRAAADAVRNVTGRSLSLRFQLGAESSAPPGGSEPVAEDELVRVIVEEFNAQELAETAPDDSEVEP